MGRDETAAVNRLLIFDFDGVIADTEAAVLQSWQELYREFGQELETRWWVDNVLGKPAGTIDVLAELEHRLAAPLDRPELARRRQERETCLVDRVAPRPGLRELLRQAREQHCRTAVASNSTRAWVLPHLRRMELVDCWDGIRCRDDVDRPKPDPQIYLRLVELLGTSAKNSIAFEDSPLGVTASANAGLVSVANPTSLTRDSSFPEARLRLDSLEGIGPAALHELLGEPF
ncbi:HAD superfamily hydrolase (TIGR01509 family) [Actinopolyspora biskrensis]|uniref:HAD superfamily hydrolase (TIGR01509 family) n=1 Tax=Actinopolyspora biskrensis TaxID=1470178 RepID=A0A852Z136_9ACTN|nr:HAD-IA family hydrolase [Actinopolyspora biskrensis]NYH77366.1 HAD superfamily hydrolase (TIGR01509 family) [Actinopolyspora biskrensis]